MNTRHVIGARIVAVNQDRVHDEGTDTWVHSVQSIDLDNGYRIVLVGVDGPDVTGTVHPRPEAVAERAGGER